MSYSASAHHTTADFHHEPGWDPPRRAFGIAGLTLSGAGLGVFVFFFAVHADKPMVTSHGMGWAALAVTMVLGGLQCARWGFGSQRAVDTKRAFVEDLLAVITRVDDLTEKVDALTAVNSQMLHETKAAAGHERTEESETKAGGQQAPPRQRRRRRREDGGAAGAADNVVPMRSRKAADALRRQIGRAHV